MAPSAKAPNMGQVIEYLPDRLYLGSYLSEPDADTRFPFGSHNGAGSRSPSKRARAGRTHEPLYFTLDSSFRYNAFHHDFGPLHVGHLFRFALQFHEILAATENQQRPVVFWSLADPRSRANASCLLACYMVLIQSWPPHLALAPIAQVDPPLMPFRDAGYSQADYGITVQDVVYGVWKAKEEGLCMLDSFNPAEYEHFERVENGDFNWVTPHFLAFASPEHEPVERLTNEEDIMAAGGLPRTLTAVDDHPLLPGAFKNVLRHFSERNIGLVVRLNSPLYSPSFFEALGIQHLDMVFADGTCPPLSTVRRFVRLAHETITQRKKAIAVHCKAGLGRTGCLIGAYLIYRHGFTANEIISFMRFMRPGMVVGPQQHWLHLNQGTFREWWVEERLERKLRRELAAAAAASAAAVGETSTNGHGNGTIPSTPIRAMQKANLGRSSQPPSASTPPTGRSVSGRSPLSEIDQERTNATSAVSVQDEHLPPPTPGQPRKGIRTADRHHPYARGSKTGSSSSNGSSSHSHETTTTTASATTTTTVEEEDEEALVEATDETESFSVHGHRSSNGSRTTDSEEEVYLRMRMHRKTVASSSPDGHRDGHRARPKAMRSASQSQHSTETSTSTLIMDSNDASLDAENIGSTMQRVKSVRNVPGREQRAASASGVLTKVRSPERTGRGGASTGAGAYPTGIRKTSGRVGSSGNAVAAVVAATAARKISGLT